MNIMMHPAPSITPLAPTAGERAGVRGATPPASTPSRFIPLLAAVLLAVPLLAFPPAPHHLVHGMVRDEMGHPFNSPNVEVLLEAGGRVIVKSTVVMGSEPGVNYRLAIPLDSGATPDLYKPDALRPTVPFRMRVRIGAVIYLPIEMTGAAHLLTRPGESSRVDLTLGVDSDGDGLPDAWEYALIQMLGGNLTLEDIRPGDDLDGDGMTNLEEYLAGTYAFDPADGFVLAIRTTAEGRSLVEFTAIRGRSYTVFSSEDMKIWTPVAFSMPGDPPGAPLRRVHQAAQTRRIQAHLGDLDNGETGQRFFKLRVQ